MDPIFRHAILLNLLSDLVAEPAMVFVHLLMKIVAVDVWADRVAEDHVRTYVAVAHFADHDFVKIKASDPKNAYQHLRHRVVARHEVYAIVADVRGAYVEDAYQMRP